MGSTFGLEHRGRAPAQRSARHSRPMPSDLFTPAWIDAYSEVLAYKDQPVAFVGVDLGQGDRTVVTIFYIGKSGWEIVDAHHSDPAR